MKLQSSSLEELEKLAEPYIKKGHTVMKPVYITFFKSDYAVKLSDKPYANCTKEESKKGCGTGLDGTHYCGENAGGYIFLCDNCTKDVGGSDEN